MIPAFFTSWGLFIVFLCISPCFHHLGFTRLVCSCNECNLTWVLDFHLILPHQTFVFDHKLSRARADKCGAAVEQCIEFRKELGDLSYQAPISLSDFCQWETRAVQTTDITQRTALEKSKAVLHIAEEHASKTWFQMELISILKFTI